MLDKALSGSKTYWGFVTFLLVLIGIGLATYGYQLREGLGITGMSRDVSWGFYIAQLTFLVGVAASAVMLVIPYYLHNFKEFGKIAILGIPPDEMSIDWTQVIFKGLILKGVYGREMFETWYKMSSMLQSGLNIEPIITHHFAADEFQNAFELMESGQSGKIILHWD